MSLEFAAILGRFYAGLTLLQPEDLVGGRALFGTQLVTNKESCAWALQANCVRAGRRAIPSRRPKIWTMGGRLSGGRGVITAVQGAISAEGMVGTTLNEFSTNGLRFYLGSDFPIVSIQVFDLCYQEARLQNVSKGLF